MGECDRDARRLSRPSINASERPGTTAVIGPVGLMKMEPPTPGAFVVSAKNEETTRIGGGQHTPMVLERSARTLAELSHRSTASLRHEHLRSNLSTVGTPPGSVSVEQFLASQHFVSAQNEGLNGLSC